MKAFGSPAGFGRSALAALALGAGLPLAGTAAESHLDFRDEARAAYQRRDYAAALAATRAALDLRPDSSLYLRNLAALSALIGEPKTAVEYLRRLAALGVGPAIERDPDFATLQGAPEFRRVLELLAENRTPRGSTEILAELPGRTGIIEGIAYRRRTGDLFLGDVHHRCIWRRDRTGQVVRFHEEDDELLGIFGLAIDEPRNILWAAMSAVPEMENYAADLKGQAALADFNLTTGELRRVIPVPGDGRDHGLGDLTVASNGTVYATDSKSPVIWKLTADAEEFEKLVEAPAFESLQGIVLDEQTLLVADYANGLFRVDTSSGGVTALRPPENTTLLGIDGLVAIPGGVIAIQNGVEPQRVLHVTLAPGFASVRRVNVLASALPELTDLCLGTLVNDLPAVIAGAGWEIYNPSRDKSPPAHTVRILQLPLPVE